MEALVLDLLEWIHRQPRTYDEVMNAWRTSCPQLPVWEEVNDRGFVERHGRDGGDALVSLTASGRAFIDTHRPKA